ncbi:unnamed protein product [Symbiodinium natans]|uniref:Uncharacterized protein n=1 Tax=Symbiodinium natans TaxID=878477 RepID=A0A812JYV1_9DINO|nr:unnamed protein product [Symbiodinium natans]
MPDEGLQGVSLAVALSGLGQHWRHLSETKVRTVSTDYYDNFLSHAWLSSGWLKYLSLLILFNAEAAMVSTILMSVLIGVLRMMAILPNMVWTQLPCYVFYFVMLAFWQPIRGIFRSPRVVFLDRLCIPQDDEEKKAAGIRGLAGYLDRTRTLTVLWSNDYFGRLWCVFELATFLRNRCNRTIQLLPVEMSMLAFLIGLCYSMVNLAHRVINEARNITGPDYDGRIETAPWLATLRATGWVAVIGSPLVPFYIYLGLDFTMKLRLLPTQLHTFDARKASCYCCTVDHTDPVSKAAIFCDRQLILEKLTEWYGWYGDPEDCEDTDKGVDIAIEQFNHLVRKELADVFLDMMSGRDVLWQYIYLLIGLNCPVCTYLLGDMGFPPDSMEGWSLHSWRARECTSFCHIFLQIFAAVQLFSTVWTLGAIYLKDHHRCMAALMLTPILVVLAVGLFYYPFRLSLELSVDGNFLPPLAAVVLEALVLVALSYTRRLATASFTRTALESALELQNWQSLKELSLRSSESGQDVPPSIVNHDDVFSI